MTASPCRYPFSPRTLESIRELAGDWIRNEIAYCHWKSNRYIDGALEGNTDLDLLVAPAVMDLARQRLVRLGFKGTTDRGSGYEGIEHWFGLDTESGRLVHVHLHSRLVIGEKHVKNYVLDCENWLLKNLSSIHGFPVPEPEKELFLLYIRALLKTDVLDVSAAYRRERLGREPSVFPERIMEEFRWLLGRSDKDRFLQVADTSGVPVDGSEAWKVLHVIASGSPGVALINRKRLEVFRSLRAYRRSSAVVCLMRRNLGMARHSYYIRATIGRLLPRCKPRGPSRNIGQGRVIALVGADGSGKSTTLASVREWIGKKADVRTLYMGKRRNGTTHVLTWLRDRLAPSGPAVPLYRIRKRLRSFLYDIEHLYQAFNRFRVARKAFAWRKAGRLVVTDRYPMPALQGMEEPMDGPRVSPDRGILHRAERFFYRHIPSPDVAIILHADVSILRQRKQDLPLGSHERKARAVTDLVDRPGCRGVYVGRPHDVVLRDVKAAIWEAV